MTKKIKKIYIYRDSHLPEEGWLQSCFDCYQITSKLILFKTYKTNNNNADIYWEIYIHQCNNCKCDENEEKQKKFLNSYNKYIHKYFPELSTR
tara:strand:- start:511 stop:789 length:279 start_codon:yes stop_codon:yes gene_type:complete